MLNKNYFIILLLIVIIGFSFGFFTSGKKQQSSPPANDTVNKPAATSELDLIILTSAPKGYNFNVSKALADALTELNFKTGVSVTGGTLQNVEDLLNGQGKLAIAAYGRVMDAYEGSGDFAGKEPATALRVIAPMWMNYSQILVKSDSDINSLKDLAGKKIAVIGRSAGNENLIGALLNAAGVFWDEEQLSHVPLAEALAGLNDGIYDAVTFMGLANGRHVKSVNKQEFSIKALPVDADVFATLNETYPHYMYGALPGIAYGLAEDIPTVITVSLLLSQEATSDDEVYELLKALFDKQETLATKYPILKETLFNIKKGLEFEIPYHSGAARFFATGLAN